MLKIRRTQIPKELKKILDRWQVSADADKIGASSRKAFKNEERKRAETGEPTVSDALAKMFHADRGS